MRTEWLYKQGGDRVIVFFNGWGMDGTVVSHLTSREDVVVIYDYRDLSGKDLPDLGIYSEIYVVAWSMGVWAAANLVPLLSVVPSKIIGLNGTEHPIHDRWGIPEKVYRLTEKGMNESGRRKFMQRMLDGERELWYFELNSSQRTLEDVCEELTRIREQCIGLQNELHWDKIYISEKDVIFPVVNQFNWWQNRNVALQTLPGGHFPFYRFQSWEEIVEVE